MTLFHYEELPNNGSKRCKFFASTLKDAFANCHTFRQRLSCSTPGEEYNPALDEDEQKVFVSEVLSRYMEAKARRKGNLTSESFCWAIDLPLGNQKKESSGGVEEREDFCSVGSCFCRCPSGTSMEAFLSVMTNLSRCSSLSRVGFLDLQSRRGWPFGLCRKALLLPPLPKSPSESWSWRKSKSAKMVK